MYNKYLTKDTFRRIDDMYNVKWDEITKLHYNKVNTKFDIDTWIKKSGKKRYMQDVIYGNMRDQFTKNELKEYIKIVKKDPTGFFIDLPTFHYLPKYDEDGKLVWATFKCPYCNKWHYHGFGDGHRTTHCTSPHLRNGYILKKYNKNELKIIKHDIEKYLKDNKND